MSDQGAAEEPMTCPRCGNPFLIHCDVHPIPCCPGDCAHVSAARSNCDVYATVDFGRGSVEVRCTETGFHAAHRCEVQINV